MKVLYQNGDRFIIDPEDGNDEHVVVSYDGESVDSIKVFPRTNSLASILRFGEWDTPDQKLARVLLRELSGKKFDVVQGAREEARPTKTSKTSKKDSKSNAQDRMTWSDPSQVTILSPQQAKAQQAKNRK